MDEMVEVFKTNVHTIHDANMLSQLITGHFPGNHVNFDLDDCDRILRIAGTGLVVDKVISLLNENGFFCTILE